MPWTVVEAKRILKPGEIFWLNVPFAFFDKPQVPMLEAFIRVMVYHLFPKLGVFGGGELQHIFKQHFPRFSYIDTISAMSNFGDSIFPMNKFAFNYHLPYVPFCYLKSS